MVLQLGALAIIAAALIARQDNPPASPARQLLALLALAIALVGAQLVPLPPSLWTHLPGRGPVADGFALLGVPLPWLPVSLAPYRTLASALWMLPAIGVLVGMLRLGAPQSAALAWGVVGVTVASVAIGAVQSAQGYGSPWYLYQITNEGVGTGFFANANHLATLLVATMPFLAALHLASRRHSQDRRAPMISLILAGVLLIVFVGLAVNRSLAGIGLSVPALAASAMMIFARERRLPAWSVGLVALATIASVAVVFAAPLGNNLTNPEQRTLTESRYTSFRTSLDAAADFMPLGSGLGTFQQIYPTHEDPAATTSVYMNHVHGDYIELALETGVPGLALVLLFLVWWVRRTAAIWTSDEPNPFARAATIASAAMLAHSIVDYPLRTAALSALFAMCCALMAEPSGRTRRREAAPSSDARHLAAD